ncbi:MAG: M48 family metallopeptidase [Gammaproteobacteria bacterium]|nr:M48 family metallopeptidase [Gammaproteobacteria bacterium]
MTGIDADYLDGRSSRVAAALARRDAMDLIVTLDDGRELRQPLDRCKVASRPAGLAPRILLDDGACLELRDEAALAALLPERRGAAGRLVHGLERRWGAALGALVLVIALVAGFLRFGIPVLAESAAFALPDDVVDSMAGGGLELLDRSIFSASSVDPARRAALRAELEKIGDWAGTSRALRLEFRASERIGANAIALPGGVIVVTDELLALSEDERELIGILAHEVGHVDKRHLLRALLQDSATAALIVALTGDVSVVSSGAAAIPLWLIQSSHSRRFEREADGFALRYLDAAGIPRRHLRDILGRLAAGGAGPSGVGGYFSTHPPTGERIPE